MIRGWNSLYESWLRPNMLALRSAWCATSGAPTFRACCTGGTGQGQRQCQKKCKDSIAAAARPGQPGKAGRQAGRVLLCGGCQPRACCLRSPASPSLTHEDEDFASPVAERVMLLQLATR